MSDDKTTRCCDCGSEFSDAELVEASECPRCGTVSRPCLIADDVTIAINWHDLRTLTIWADNWAQAKCPEHSRRTLAAILRRVHAQYPDRTPLTIAGEMAQIHDVIPTAGDVEMHNPDGSTTKIPKPDKH